MKSKYIFGSISHGTMRLQDLIPIFRQTLRQLDPRARIYRIPRSSDPNHPFWESAAAVILLEYLFSSLNLRTAPYFYFGAHPDDGADYGFWLDGASLYADVMDGTILCIPAGTEWPSDVQDYEYVLETNDQGKMALYDPQTRGNLALYDPKTHEEIWRI